MQFHPRLTALVLFTGLASTSAMADHNSVWGAGWANMPNDIHNTRIEGGLSQTEFRDFVRQGAGSQTVNRYLDSSTISGQRSMAGSASPSAKASTTGQGAARR